MKQAGIKIYAFCDLNAGNLCFMGAVNYTLSKKSISEGKETISICEPSPVREKDFIFS